MGRIVKKFKFVEVEEIPTSYRVRSERSYWEFESKEEAIKFAEEKNKEIENEKKTRDSKDYFELIEALFIKEQLRKYIEMLKKRLWHYRKYKGINKEDAERIKEMRNLIKEIISELTEIYSGKVEVEWMQDYFGSVFYTIKQIDKDEIRRIPISNKILENLGKEVDKRWR